MKVTGFAKAATIVGVLAFVASATPALAQDKTEAKCRSTIAKNLGKYVATAGKAIVACHKDTNSGKRTDGADCNDPLDADTKGKVGPTGDKMLAGIIKACEPNGVIQTNVLAEFSSCPSPNQAADGGDGIDTFTELSECLEATANTWSKKMYDEVLGAPDTLDKTGQKCHGTIAKSVAKLVATVGKDRAKCQATVDKGSPGISNHVGCSESDDKGKIAKTRTKLLDGIAKSCGGVDFSLFNACDPTEATYTTCALDRAMDSIAGGLSSMAWELPAGCPVDGVRVFINPGFGTVKDTNTTLSTGYTGAAFGADVIEGYEGAVTVDCSGSDDCSACTVTLDAVKDQGNAYCRCDNDVTATCDTINGADADDCGGGDCSCFFGPPLPLAAGGVSTCVVNEIVQELDGVADIGNGDSTTTVSSQAKVHTGGTGTLTQPCPICTGDNTPNDGVRDGVCDGGDRDGLACDENGNTASFGGGLSYDCQPDPGTNVTGTGLVLALELTTATTALDQSIDCGGGLTGNDCHCRSCAADATVGCNSDQDCVDAGVGGVCGNGAEPQTQPNSCSDATCTSNGDGTGFGLCLSNAPASFCEGAVQASGKGIIPCSNNGDCDAVDSSCDGGDCGDCTISAAVECFDGTIGAEGTPGSLGAELVSTFCTAHTGNAGVNAAGGLPGPGRLVLDFDFEARCSDGDLAQAPGFVNCQ